MNEQLLQELHSQFEIIAITDLAELSVAPSSALHFFQSAYRQEYSTRCRIIVYTDKPVPGKLLRHLYETTDFLDISNYFVVFCTPHSIVQQLSVSEMPSFVPFQNIVLPVTGNLLSTTYQLPDTICAIPWSNINLRSSGEISPCCMSLDSLGDINKDSLSDVFYGPAMQQLRQEFVDGKRPQGCSPCWNNEDRGLTSIRLHNKKRLKQRFLESYFEQPKIANLDISFQNTCNFKCRICLPESSSLVAEEHSRLFKIPMQPQSKWSESDHFTQQITDLLPQIINIDMYGGEPFLIKKFAKVLESAIETDTAKNIRLHYNSNGSIWPGAFIEYWPHFKEVDIHFSIDAIGNQFEYQRGGLWSEVEENVLRVKNLGFPNLKIRIMPSISIMNVLYIDQVLDWAKQHDFPAFVSHVTMPDAFSLSNLTQSAKDLIIDKYKHHPWDEMKKILELVTQVNPTDGQAFCQRIALVDQARNENFAESHSAIANAMGYVYNTKNY